MVQLKDKPEYPHLVLWILNKILEDYKEISEIKDVIDGFYISMNISLKEIENEYIIVNLIEKLRNSGIEEKSICIEKG